MTDQRTRLRRRARGRQADLDPRPGDARFDHDRTAELLDALAQADRRGVGRQQGVEVEPAAKWKPAAVVRNHQLQDAVGARVDLDRDARRMRMLERVDRRFSYQQPHAFLHVGSETQIRWRHAHRDRRLPLDAEPIAQLLERARDAALLDRTPRRRLEIFDEAPQLALLDRDRALDREQVIGDGRLLRLSIGERLQLKPDPGERLQYAVMEIAGDTEAIFADRHLLQPLL